MVVLLRKPRKHSTAIAGMGKRLYGAGYLRREPARLARRTSRERITPESRGIRVQRSRAEWGQHSQTFPLSSSTQRDSSVPHRLAPPGKQPTALVVSMSVSVAFARFASNHAGDPRTRA